MAHIHEKIDFIVDVLIVYQNKVLIRKHEKYDKWLAVGGHIELDENPDQAAIREVKEEVGLDVELVPSRKMPVPSNFEKCFTELTPPWYCYVYKINDSHQHVSLVYFAVSKTDIIVPEEQSDISNEWKWFSKEELEKNEYEIPESILFYAKEALKELGK